MSPERLKATMPSPVILQHVAGTDITDTMVEEAAELFSRFYGVWGPLADQHLGSFAKQGRRVRMSAANLRRQILPDHGDNSYVRAMVGNELVGNVFATRYDIVSDGPSTSKVCWITQLCVDPRYRRQGLATKMIRMILQNRGRAEEDTWLGILSSHPAAILATLRACGGGPETVDPGIVTARRAQEGMRSCPVSYVRHAKLRGSCFEENSEEGVVSCADTGFWVDHGEPMGVLQAFKARGLRWAFGDLPEGHEFLALLDLSVTQACTA